MNYGSKTSLKNVIGRISDEKLHLCEPGLSVTNTLLNYFMILSLLKSDKFGTSGWYSFARLSHIV